jgi:hypothetical protein
MHASTTRSNTRRKMSLSRNFLRARENAEWSCDAELAEPAVRQVHLNLAAQRPLRADCKQVPDNEHPDRQHWIIDGRPIEG